VQFIATTIWVSTADARRPSASCCRWRPDQFPRWQFLCYLADHKPIVLHGSGNPGLSEVEPRQTNDLNEFSNRRAIYAASDGIWPIYFAIRDREQHAMSLTNACYCSWPPSLLAEVEAACYNTHAFAKSVCRWV
jgi:hypothetical protein